MITPLHQNLSHGGWQMLSLSEQMGNIGAEIGRAKNWSKQGNISYRDRALERALELFDLTIADPRWRGRLKEIVRAREVVCDVFYGDNAYHDSGNALEKYFLGFAIAARRDR